MAKRHWMWDAYLALTQERRMTESEAIGELTALWPSLPVFELVRAEGDVSRTLGDVMNQPHQRQQGQQQGNQQGSGNAQGERQEPTHDPQDLNAAIRARAGVSSGASNLTNADILSAGTGRKPDGQDAERADGFIRGRFAERYGQG